MPFEHDLAALIDEARAHFISGIDSQFLCENVKVYEKIFHGKRVRIFGVNKEDQQKLDYSALQHHLTNAVGLKPGTPILQVIGDSKPYSMAGSEVAKKYLTEKLQTHKSHMLLYGVTGGRIENRIDANQIMNEWLDEHEDNARYVIGNIVDLHSPMALRAWSSKAAKNLSNFLLVYTDTPEPEARFGDDTILSDSLTTTKSFFLMGGIQTFRQCVFMLQNDVHIECVSNLRWLEDPVDYDASTNSFIRYFAASEFFAFICRHSVRLSTMADEQARNEVIKLKDEYMRDRHLFDPRRKDGATKQALFNVAWEEFIEHKLWKKLPKYFLNANDNSAIAPPLLLSGVLSNRTSSGNDSDKTIHKADETKDNYCGFKPGFLLKQCKM